MIKTSFIKEDEPFRKILRRKRVVMFMPWTRGTPTCGFMITVWAPDPSDKSIGITGVVLFKA